MRAVRFSASGRVEVGDVPEPSLALATDAIVRVELAGICGTDLHLVSSGPGLEPGMVMGHEFVGTVVEVGAAVTAVAPGDRVAGSDFVACGSCWWCRRGDHWECEHRAFFGTGTSFGPALPGAQAEFVRVPFADAALQVLDPHLPAQAALFLGDVLATGYAAVRRAHFRPGDTVVVVGGGPVGQLASQVAQACGAGPVVVVEPVAERRALAQRCGALAAEPEDAPALVRELTSGRGADAAIEAVGGRRGLETALSSLRRRGVLVSVGVQADETWPMPVARAFADELTVTFGIGNAIRDRDEIAALLGAGVVDPTVLIDATVDIESAPDGYAAMRDRRSVKTVIAF